MREGGAKKMPMRPSQRLEQPLHWTIALYVQRSASGGLRGVCLVKSRPLIGDRTAASNFDRLILAWTSV